MWEYKNEFGNYWSVQDLNSLSMLGWQLVCIYPSPKQGIPEDLKVWNYIAVFKRHKEC